MLLLLFAGWLNRHQLDVIEYLQEENRVLKERMGGRRLRFTDARFGHQQIVLATSERSLLTVLLPARQLRESIEMSFQAAVAELLAALQLPAQIVSRELAAVQPISFAAASNRRVIGSMNEYVWQLGSYLTHAGDPLELSMQLNKTPMSAVGSKSNYGFPDEIARELLLTWEH
jgi:hypothetical protein